VRLLGERYQATRQQALVAEKEGKPEMALSLNEESQKLFAQMQVAEQDVKDLIEKRSRIYNVLNATKRYRH
jgi:hypothetical protein